MSPHPLLSTLNLLRIQFRIRQSLPSALNLETSSLYPDTQYTVRVRRQREPRRGGRGVGGATSAGRGGGGGEGEFGEAFGDRFELEEGGEHDVDVWLGALRFVYGFYCGGR